MNDRDFPTLSTTESTPILGTRKRRWFKDVPKRYYFCILGFLGIFNAYTMRVNLSVAMVAMVMKPPLTDALKNGVACAELLPKSQLTNTTFVGPLKSFVQGEFDWSSSLQGVLLGSFFYGYVITQIPGGIIAERFGAKLIFGIGILVTAICTLLTPLAARFHVGALIAVRFIEGLGEGVLFPAMNALIGRWVPKNERSRIATFIFTGSPMGTVVAMVSSGFLSGTQFLGGWPSVFYVFGILSLLWFVAWIRLVYDSPDDHPSITKAELYYIRQGQDHTQNSNSPIPWRRMLTSCPVITLIITHFGYNWGFYTLLTELPTYLSNILHFDLQKNGTLSALPYLCQAIFAYFASILADWLRSSDYLRVTTIRKVMNSIAFYGPAIIVFCISFVGCNPLIIVFLLTLSVGLNGFMFSGFNVTHIDMSPQFAGTLMGITNCVANIAGFLSPAYAGMLVKNGQTVRNWSYVFATCSAVYVITGTLYNLFASAEPQSWGMTQTQDPPPPPPSLENPPSRRSSLSERST